MGGEPELNRAQKILVGFSAALAMIFASAVVSGCASQSTPSTVAFPSQGDTAGATSPAADIPSSPAEISLPPTTTPATTAAAAKTSKAPAPPPTTHSTRAAPVRTTHVAAPPPTTHTASTCGAPANPDGYTFCGGSLIYSPDSNVCEYFNCIDNFSNGKGYMVECNDGTYSMSGGRSGACSYHKGEERPVYDS